MFLDLNPAVKVRGAAGNLALLEESVVKDVDGIAVCVASIPHLIEMKQRSARPRDLEDIDKLRQILDDEQGRADESR